MSKLFVKLICNKIKHIYLRMREMMILVKLDKTTYGKIKTLIEKGNYASIENFIEIAVKNQLLIESEGRLELAKGQIIQRVSETEKQPLSTLLRVPDKQFIPTMTAQTLDASIRSAPIWGQINRLAPMKFVLRVLLNSLVTSDEGSMDLKRFSAEVAEKASEFRIFVKKKDKMKRIRGEEFYVGFPKKDPSSQQRFLNYYVGKAQLKKWTDGILAGLSLANIEEMEDGSTQIGLTETGRKFALLHSPLVDDFFLDGRQVDAPFSSDEVSFLVDHIKAVRPGDYEFLVFTLSSIKKGADTPTKLRVMIFDFLKGKDLEIKISDKVANTMQVGAIGRLVEMGLLKIEKEAQRSRYLVTEKGGELIGKL